MTTTTRSQRDACRHRSRLPAQSAHRDRTHLPDRCARPRCTAGGTFRRFSRLRSSARAGANRGARPGRDPGRSVGHTAIGRLVGGHRKRQDSAIHFQPGPLGNPSGIRSRRRPLSPASSRHRAIGRIRRHAAAGRGSAPAVTLEFVDGIPRAFRIHQRSALAHGIARCSAVDGQAANSRCSRRGAGADIRRRGSRAAD